MPSILPARPLRIAARGLVPWLVGMVIGTVVFGVPALKATPAIPYLSPNPLISIPIIAAWIPLAFALSHGPVSRASDPAAEGLRIGVMFLAVNAVLDAVLLVGVMDEGPDFYRYASIWLAYATLLIVPWAAGRAARPASGRT